MANKEQAVNDFDNYRMILGQYERGIRKALAAAKSLKALRAEAFGDATRKADLKAIVDATPETITSLEDRGKLATTTATYLVGKYPDLNPNAPAVEPPSA